MYRQFIFFAPIIILMVIGVLLMLMRQDHKYMAPATNEGGPMSHVRTTYRNYSDEDIIMFWGVHPIVRVVTYDGEDIMIGRINADSANGYELYVPNQPIN